MRTRFRLLLGLSFLVPAIPSDADDPKEKNGKGGLQVQQSAWIQSAGQSGSTLGSEKVRAELDLTDEQEKKIAALTEKAGSLWKDHLDEGIAARNAMGERALAILTDAQIDQLKKLKAVEGSWFHTAGNQQSRGQIGLTAEQETRINKIMEKHHAERTAAFQSVAKADPEAAERSRKLREKHQEILTEAQKTVRGLLDDSQFDALLTNIAQTQFQSIFQQKRYEKELGLTEEQSEKLSAWVAQRTAAAREIAKIKDSEERVEKWKAWRDESGAGAFALLTDEQKDRAKKLRTVEAMWFYSLSTQGTLDKLKLRDDQRKRVEAAIKDYQDKRAGAFKVNPEVAARSREVQEEYKKMVADAQVKIRDVLTEKQFDALITGIAKTQIPYLFRRADVAKELALTPDQIKKLEETAKWGNENTAKRSREVWEERNKLYEEAEAILTPEQKEKLSKLSGARPVIRYRVGEGGTAVEKR